MIEIEINSNKKGFELHEKQNEEKITLYVDTNEEKRFLEYLQNSYTFTTARNLQCALITLRQLQKWDEGEFSA